MESLKLLVFVVNKILTKENDGEVCIKGISKIKKEVNLRKHIPPLPYLNALEDDDLLNFVIQPLIHDMLKLFKRK